MVFGERERTRRLSGARLAARGGHAGKRRASEQMAMARRLITIAVFLIAWRLGVWIFQLPPFILPPPESVFLALWENAAHLAYHGAITFAEIVLGLVIGTFLGLITALAMNATPFLWRTFHPLVIASQALPVFAIAPLLVLWFGLGLGSKIAMATLIIYFPVTSTLSDGLARTQGDLVDLARLSGASRFQTLIHFRLPASLPALASGLRLAANIAPIGAIVGEWVGAAAGLGYIINQANARMQTDIVFAALFLLVMTVLLLRMIIDGLLDRYLHWVPKTRSF